MKTFLQLLGITLCGFVLMGGVFFWMVIRPITLEEARLKPILPPLASEFMICIQKYDLKACYDRYTTEKFKAVANFQQFSLIANKIKAKLGDRISARLVPESFNLKVFKGPGGTTRTVDFVMKVIYRNDATVTESWIYSVDQKSKEYRAQSFFVNSNKMIE